MDKPKQILLRGPNFIGDHVMAEPFYRGLRTSYPDANLTFLCPQAVSGLSHLAQADRVVVLSNAQRKSFPGIIKIARSLKTQFDLGITLPASYSSSLLLFVAGAKNRVGYSLSGSDLFLTQSLAWPGRYAQKHKAQLYLDLLDWMTAGHNKLLEIPRRTNSAQPYFVLAPGASISLREWPNVLPFTRQLAEKFPDHEIYVVGSEADRKWSSQFARLGIHKVKDFIGQTTLQDLIALCKSAQTVFANDSGIAHVAASLAQSPTIVFFGPGDPSYVAPRGNSMAVRIDLPCSPCESAHCAAPFGYQKCLRGLSAESVVEAALALTK